jgi:hypothetical protein
MRRSLAPLVLLLAFAAQSSAEEATPTTTVRKRNWLGRLFHPFSSNALPQYKDPRLRGLTLDLLVTPQIINLSELRQLQIKLTLTNQSKRPVTLEFPTDQRIEIYLRNSAEIVLTKWTDNHAINQAPATVLINPQEHIEYNETISTRELTPNKVFIVDVFFPQYPELRIRQKILTAP